MGGMEDRHTPMDPNEAERRSADMLDGAGLPRFAAARHDSDVDMLEFVWEHGLTIHFDLTREMDPIDDWEREAIRASPLGTRHEPIRTYISESKDDPHGASGSPA